MKFDIMPVTIEIPTLEQHLAAIPGMRIDQVTLNIIKSLIQSIEHEIEIAQGKQTEEQARALFMLDNYERQCEMAMSQARDDFHREKRLNQAKWEQRRDFFLNQN